MTFQLTFSEDHQFKLSLTNEESGKCPYDMVEGAEEDCRSHSLVLHTSLIDEINGCFDLLEFSISIYFKGIHGAFYQVF